MANCASCCAASIRGSFELLSKQIGLHKVRPEVADLTEDSFPEGPVPLEDEDGQEDGDDAGHDEVVVVHQVVERLHIELIWSHVSDLLDGDGRRRQAHDDWQVDAQAGQRLGIDAGDQVVAVHPGGVQLVGGDVGLLLFAFVQVDPEVDEHVKQDADDLHDAVDPAEKKNFLCKLLLLESSKGMQNNDIRGSLSVFNNTRIFKLSYTHSFTF